MPLAPPVGVFNATVFAVSVPALRVIEPPVVPPLAVSIVIVPVAAAPALIFAPMAALPVPPPAALTLITSASVAVLVV